MISTKKSWIFGIIAIMISVACIFSSYDGHLQLALLPFIIPAALAAAGGLADLFSKDDRYSPEELRQMLLDSGYKFFDEGKATGDLARLTSSRIKGRRAGIDAKDAQAGLNNPTDVYSNEEDLVNSEILGQNQIRATKAQADNQIANTLFNLNLSQGKREPGLSRFIGGALTGANIGFNVGGLLGKGLPKNPTDTTPQTKETPVAEDTSSDNTYTPLDTKKGLSFKDLGGGDSVSLKSFGDTKSITDPFGLGDGFDLQSLLGDIKKSKLSKNNLLSTLY